jgi:hypothetical protein
MYPFTLVIKGSVKAAPLSFPSQYEQSSLCKRVSHAEINDADVSVGAGYSADRAAHHLHSLPAMPSRSPDAALTRGPSRMLPLRFGSNVAVLQWPLPLMMMIIMSMGWEYVSEMQPPTSPQVTHGHGGPWWNDIDRGKFAIRPPELYYNHIFSHLVAKQEEIVMGMNMASQNIFLHTSKGSLTCRKILQYGANGFPSEESRLADFYCPTNPSPRTGWDPRNVGRVFSCACSGCI